MILADYLRSEKDITWDYARQCGVKNAVIRLPEQPGFDICNPRHWQEIYTRFSNFEMKPVVVEPLPDSLHSHIKAGDQWRDASIEKVIKMLFFMNEFDIRTLCFNFMAYVGWCRTNRAILDRGGALVTGFDMGDYKGNENAITKEQLWENYTYFIKAVLPYAERYHIRLALHPDDPPVPGLGEVKRIMVSHENIKRAVSLSNSKFLGITMCQACYQLMGEDLYQVVPEMKDKIFFIHFRNVMGTKERFHETFHDNGDIDMPGIISLYQKCGIHVPIRVDHVPTMAGETETTGYTPLGRLYAIGYLRGLLEGTGKLSLGGERKC